MLNAAKFKPEFCIIFLTPINKLRGAATNILVRKPSSKIVAIFNTWLQEHGGIATKIARSFSANPEDQSNLLQEMYLQVWRSIELG